MPIKGNKGEWSEFYAFIKILTDGKVFTANKDLEILRDHFYLVLKIIREEAKGIKSYDISKNDGNVLIRDGNDSKIGEINLNDVKSKVSDIFKAMKDSSGTTFRISTAESVMKDLHCSKLKASSGKKADLVIVLHDKKSPEFPKLGFSIKSMLGSPSTLLNSSGATNFIYKAVENKPEKTNQKKTFTVREAAAQVYGSGGKLEFCGMGSETFRANLRKIDSNFHIIMAEITRHYYAGHGTKISDLVELVASDDKFVGSIDLAKDALIIKIKRFLSAIALGMTPGKNWDGKTQTHGGYIIVKEDGDVVCYHLYNRDQFEDYLFNNVKLDTPSTKKHKFGKFYREAGEKRIKFNLQIRFLR